MSRFGELLRKSLATTPPALGFRPAPTSKPRMTLITVLNELPETASAWVRGADAVLLSANIKAKELKTAAKSIAMPWGVRLDGSAQTARQAETAGADFVAFEPGKTGIDVITDEDLGKVLVIDYSLENALLHSANELSIEAICLEREPQNTITWLDLMQFRRLSELVAKPLIVAVGPDISPLQIKALWEAGVDALLVAALAEDEIKGLRQKMDDLMLPTRHKWLRARPLVPAMNPAPPAVEHEEEEQEEEDD